VFLDDRPVMTPGRAALVVPSAALAEAIVGEWQAQGAKVEPATMPMLQLSNAAIDRVAPDPARIASEIAAYAETDLICHWAPEPAELVERQRAHWQPLLDWAALALDAPLQPVAGVLAAAQPEASLAALRAAVAALDAFRLTGLHLATTTTGSIVIALAILRGRLDPDAGWQASQVDEAYQTERWGEDTEAAARRTARRSDLMTGARFLALLEG